MERATLGRLAISVVQTSLMLVTILKFHSMKVSQAELIAS